MLRSITRERYRFLPGTMEPVARAERSYPLRGRETERCLHEVLEQNRIRPDYTFDER